MRIKQAEIKEVDDKWVCTDCLSRYNSKHVAYGCAESHNTKRIREANEMMDNFIKNNLK